jgi:hypothetical protein
MVEKKYFKSGVFGIKFIIYRGVAHGFAVGSVSLTPTNLRIAGMKTMKPRQMRWKKPRKKFWLFLASFSTNKIMLKPIFEW